MSKVFLSLLTTILILTSASTSVHAQNYYRNEQPSIELDMSLIDNVNKDTSIEIIEILPEDDYEPLIIDSSFNKAAPEEPLDIINRSSIDETAQPQKRLHKPLLTAPILPPRHVMMRKEVSKPASTKVITKPAIKPMQKPYIAHSPDISTLRRKVTTNIEEDTNTPLLGSTDRPFPTPIMGELHANNPENLGVPEIQDTPEVTKVSIAPLYQEEEIIQQQEPVEPVDITLDKELDMPDLPIIESPSKKAKANIEWDKKSKQAVPSHNELSLLFNGNVTDLQSKHHEKLNSIVQELTESPELRLQLRAYAEGLDGSNSSAKRLSLARALSIRSYLMDNNIQATRIDVRALGSSSDRSPIDRVDVIFF